MVTVARRYGSLSVLCILEASLFHQLHHILLIIEEEGEEGEGGEGKGEGGRGRGRGGGGEMTITRNTRLRTTTVEQLVRLTPSLGLITQVKVTSYDLAMPSHALAQTRTPNHSMYLIR